jgi:hypothetical protein
MIGFGRKAAMMAGMMAAASMAVAEPSGGVRRRPRPVGEPETEKDAPEGSRQHKRWLQRQARKQRRRFEK